MERKERKTLESKTDAELVALSRDGSQPGAYAELITRHYDRCFRRAQTILNEPADAEDVVQEAFVRALLKLDQLEHPDRFAGWLDRIVVSQCVSKVRRQRPELIDPSSYEATLNHLEDEQGDPEKRAIASEREAAVMDAISQLPEKYRDPIHLFHLKGQSYKNIAEMLNLPVGTVQSLISRARDRLETLLKPYYWTPIHQI